MRRTTLFIALASAFSLSTAFAQSSQDPSSQSAQQDRQTSSQPQAQSPEVVKQVQQKLSAEGQKVTADGKMGPQTQAALKEYQQKNGLQASGQIDQETLAKLGIESGSSATGGTSGGAEERSGAGGSASGKGGEKAGGDSGASSAGSRETGGK